MIRDAYVGIADPTRRQILTLLDTEGTHAAGDIAARFETVSRPAISKHLRILKECELVTVKRQGKAQLYTLNEAPLKQVNDWLEGFAARQVQSLKNLRQIVESEP